MVGTHAYLLVGVEAHADVAVLDLRMVTQVAHGLHDLCHAGLVVSAKQRRTVGDDKVLTFVCQELGELLRRGDNARRELDVAAVVVLHDTCLDIGTAGIERRIVVRDEADGRGIFLCIAGKGGIDITHVVHLHILKTLMLKLFLEILGKDELFRGTRNSGRILGRLCVKLGVIDKSFY